jgi:dienelactone hydrolase
LAPSIHHPDPACDCAEDNDVAPARDRAVSECIVLPWGETQRLKGRFLPAPVLQKGERAPAILCLADEGSDGPSVAELCRHAHGRGLSLLLVDIGDLSLSDHDAPEHRFDREAAISSLVDYLQSRIDIDPDKIAIFGRGPLADLATRVACYDGRFAAAVCDAGIWDWIERAFMDPPFSYGQLQDISLDLFVRSSIALAIRCPILVVVGEDDWLEPDYAEHCCKLLSAAGKQIEFRILLAASTVAMADADGAGRPRLNSEAVFDWLAQRIAGSA